MTDLKPIEETEGKIIPMRKTKMIRISLPVTLHRPGPNYQPAEYHAPTGMMVGGRYDIEVVPAGTEFEIEEVEGLRLVKRFENYPGASGPTIQGIVA
jgi:hypothetical protein